MGWSLGYGRGEEGVRPKVKGPRGLKEAFKTLLSLDAPSRTKAKAFAVGVFVAFTPTYGLHTVTVILFSWLFRLPFSIVLLGSLVNNPWTFFPIYGVSYVAGRWLLSFFPSFYSPVPFHVLAHRLKVLSWKEWFTKAPIILLKEGPPFVVGSLVLGVVTALASYFLVLWLLEMREGKGSTRGSGAPLDLGGDGRGEDEAGDP